MTNHISEGAPHALEKGTDRERRVYLERALKTAYVYAQLKGWRGADGHERVLTLDLGLGALAIAHRQVAMMDKETVGLTQSLAIHAKRGAHHLALLTRIGEDKATMAASVVENVSY